MTSNLLPDHFFKQIVETNWVAVTFADLEGNIIYANKSSCDLYAYEHDELIGNHVDIFNADDSLDTATIVNDIKSKGRWSGELIQKKKNGTTFPAFLTVWLIHDQDGNPYGLVSNSKDLTEEKEADKKIKENSETLKLLLDSLPIGIFILDHQGKPYYANNFTKALAHKTPETKVEQLEGMNEWKVYKQYTDIPYPFKDLPITCALKGEKSTKTDLDILIEDQRYHVSATAQPVYVNGEIKYAVSAFLDISEILDKQKEIERRESEIQALINSYDFYFFSVDKNFKIIRYNNAFKKIFGAGGIKIDGFSVKDIIPNSQLKEIETLYNLAFSGESITDIREYEAGEGYRTYETKYAPIYTGGEIYAVSVISQNITRRIEGENQLKEVLSSLSRRESEISSIINNTDALILSIDKKFKVIEYNDAFQQMALKNFNVKKLKGTSILNYLLPSSHDHLRAIYKRVFNGESVVDEHGYETPLGYFVYETRYNPIVNRGKVIAISIFSQNISSRKENEQRLKAALNEKELLLNEIHHRVKNNLAIISSLLQLEELKTSNKEIKDILISSQNRIKSTALVHQFLYQNDSIAKIKFSEYVKEFINQIEKSLVSDKQINISISGEDFDLDIEQAIPCGLIINELFTNSVKHAFPNTLIEAKINIYFKKENGGVQLIFSDNGIGFNDGIYSNNTLGLTVVKTLVKQLQGELVINSKKGAVFSVSFPI